MRRLVKPANSNLEASFHTQNHASVPMSEIRKDKVVEKTEKIEKIEGQNGFYWCKVVVAIVALVLFILLAYSAMSSKISLDSSVTSKSDSKSVTIGVLKKDLNDDSADVTLAKKRSDGLSRLIEKSKSIKTLISTTKKLVEKSKSIKTLFSSTKNVVEKSKTISTAKKIVSKSKASKSDFSTLPNKITQLSNSAKTTTLKFDVKKSPEKSKIQIPDLEINSDESSLHASTSTVISKQFKSDANSVSKEVKNRLTTSLIEDDADSDAKDDELIAKYQETLAKAGKKESKRIIQETRFNESAVAVTEIPKTNALEFLQEMHKNQDYFHCMILIDFIV